MLARHEEKEDDEKRLSEQINTHEYMRGHCSMRREPWMQPDVGKKPRMNVSHNANDFPLAADKHYMRRYTNVRRLAPQAAPDHPNGVQAPRMPFAGRARQEERKGKGSSSFPRGRPAREDSADRTRIREN
ncbi:hypothetical protein K438DRAFT_1771318 [Mycena galopus ATCC 62051]|nr:hypothetical protein K438DRAFT_1771318 [Mycena galopus ATCC 62051]